ncbi:MAG: hypothetical protein MJ133_00930 [Lachnospiraceae bacterium]|nr:hypothetical protein [Lachnospiraceae bacterium]
MKKKLLTTLLVIALLLLLCGGAVVVIDPFMHFHGPLAGLEYPLKDERYINDGIQRHYDYSVMITGTSMSQNMRPSLWEDLTGDKAIKTCYSSASFYELSQSMERAIAYNSGLKVIISSLDPSMMATDPEEVSYEGIPTYLYDDNVFNDVNYIFNKDVLLKCLAVINYTRAGNKTTDLDTYGRYDIYHSFGKESILQTFTRAEKIDVELDESQPVTAENQSAEDQPVTAENRPVEEQLETTENRLKTSESMLDKATTNLEENYLSLIRKNPEVNFKFFIPAYSVYYWDNLSRKGLIDDTIEVEKYVVSELLKEQNVEVYVFDDLTEITNNPDRYMDMLHYDGEMADYILESVADGRHKIELGTAEQYFEDILDYYNNLDFEKFF